MRAVLCALAILLILPATTVSSSGDTLARKALSLAKQANAKATKALASQSLTGAQGASGADGSNGSNGRSGQDGRDGIDGARGAAGAAGATGAKGDTGEGGPQGPAGIASLDALSATNPSTVTIDSAPTVVTTLDIQRESPGSAFITFDGQVNGENGTADAILCELRVDAATVAERYYSVGGQTQVSVSESALVILDAGPHTAAVSCRKSSSLSLVQFPQGRTRLTVLAG